MLQEHVICRSCMSTDCFLHQSALCSFYFGRQQHLNCFPVFHSSLPSLSKCPPQSYCDLHVFLSWQFRGKIWKEMLTMTLTNYGHDPVTLCSLLKSSTLGIYVPRKRLATDMDTYIITLDHFPNSNPNHCSYCCTYSWF